MPFWGGEATKIKNTIFFYGGRRDRNKKKYHFLFLLVERQKLKKYRFVRGRDRNKK